MARVTKKIVTVTEYSLELSAEEAGVLRSVFQNVAGAPEGLRGIVDAVDEALREAGMDPVGTPTGRIVFNLEDNDEN